MIPTARVRASWWTRVCARTTALRSRYYWSQRARRRRGERAAREARCVMRLARIALHPPGCSCLLYCGGRSAGFTSWEVASAVSVSLGAIVVKLVFNY